MYCNTATMSIGRLLDYSLLRIEAYFLAGGCIYSSMDKHEGGGEDVHT